MKERATVDPGRIFLANRLSVEVGDQLYPLHIHDTAFPMSFPVRSHVREHFSLPSHAVSVFCCPDRYAVLRRVVFSVDVAGVLMSCLLARRVDSRLLVFQEIRGHASVTLLTCTRVQGYGFRCVRVWILQSPKTWWDVTRAHVGLQSRLINLATAVQVSIDTAVQHCEVCNSVVGGWYPLLVW